MLTEPKLFVFGATGRTGRRVVDFAMQDGMCVAAHVRPNSTSSMAAIFEAWGASVHRTEFDGLRPLISDVAPTHVYCLLGTTRARKKSLEKSGRSAAEETYAAVDRDLTLKIIDACADAAPTATIIYLSAAGAGGKSGGAYMAARHAVEAELDTRAAHGMRSARLRPALILGEKGYGARTMEGIGAALTNPLLKLAGALGATGVRDRYLSTDTIALAHGLVSLAQRSAEGVLEGAALRALYEGAQARTCRAFGADASVDAVKGQTDARR